MQSLWHHQVIVVGASLVPRPMPSILMLHNNNMLNDLYCGTLLQVTRYWEWFICTCSCNLTAL